MVGATVGTVVGGDCDGMSVGAEVGDLDGTAVGIRVGNLVGTAVGTRVGIAVGIRVGNLVGTAVGARVGNLVGIAVGTRVGAAVGDLVDGWFVGSLVGEALGLLLGACVPIVGVAVGLEDPVKIIAGRLVIRPVDVVTTTGVFCPLLSEFRPDDITETESRD